MRIYLTKLGSPSLVPGVLFSILKNRAFRYVESSMWIACYSLYTWSTSAGVIIPLL